MRTSPRARTRLAPALAAGVVAALFACRSEEPVPQATPTPDASNEDGGADAGAEAGLVLGCPGETPTDYPWSPPVAREDACTDSDLAKLSLAIKGASGVTIGDIRAALGPACAACALGRATDATWRAIVDGHEGYIGNVGGCVVHLGATEACGRATDRLSTCLIIGCAGCAEGDDQDVCADALTAADGRCAADLRALRSQCRSGSISDAFSPTGPCQSFVGTIRLFCGPVPPADAGSD